jgi:hypothetical protein
MGHRLDLYPGMFGGKGPYEFGDILPHMAAGGDEIGKQDDGADAGFYQRPDLLLDGRAAELQKAAATRSKEWAIPAILPASATISSLNAGLRLPWAAMIRAFISLPSGVAASFFTMYRYNRGVV